MNNQYVEALKIQLKFIENSCELFDAGCQHEALRIATSISTLVIDSKNQTSILKHILEAEGYQKITLLSTNTIGVEDSNFFNLLSYFDNESKLIPYLDKNNLQLTHPEPMSINNWLDQKVVSLDEFNPKRKMICLYPPVNRRTLIRVARDKDGGSHYDKSINDDSYELLQRGTPIFYCRDKEITIEGMHLVSLRQLGYEILNSDLLYQISG